MTTAISSPRHDDHGASGLPRTRALIRTAAAAGLAQLRMGTGDVANIIKSRFANLSDRDRAALNYFGANEVPAVDVAAATVIGQVQTGVALSTILGRIKGAIDVELNTDCPALSAADVSGAIIHQPGHAIPLIASTFKRCSTAPVRASAIIAVSGELLSQPSAEAGLHAVLMRAATKAADAEFISRALNGAAVTASGATDPQQLLAQVAAMGAALVAAGADPRFIALAVNPATLLQLATASTTFGTVAFPSLTVQGGDIAGLPVHASQGVAAGTIVAIAGDSILRSSAPPRVVASTDCDLEMSSAPTGEAEPGETPVAASQQRVSMFSTDMVALKVLVTFGVDFTRTTRAAFIDDIALSASVTS